MMCRKHLQLGVLALKQAVLRLEAAERRLRFRPPLVQRLGARLRENEGLGLDMLVKRLGAAVPEKTGLGIGMLLQ